MVTEATDIRRKRAGWRAAERAAKAEHPTAMSAEESLGAAEELRNLNPDAFRGGDPIREREVSRAREAWNTLRRRWRRDASSRSA